jgi:hypothetical protein
MRRSTRRELVKLRELAWHFLDGVKCEFCGKPILPRAASRIRFGTSKIPPLPDSVIRTTIHHRNENRRDNTKRNRGIAQQSCHMQHHIHKTKPHLYRSAKPKPQLRRVA